MCGVLVFICISSDDCGCCTSDISCQAFDCWFQMFELSCNVFGARAHMKCKLTARMSLDGTRPERKKKKHVWRAALRASGNSFDVCNMWHLRYMEVLDSFCCMR